MDINMSLQIKVIIFIISSAGFVWLSWSSLRNLRSHGFYRFFFFETISALILLNLDYWFQEPFSLRQLISWLLLMISAFMVVHGFLLLRWIGKPDTERIDPTLIGIEKTTQMVTTGAYRYIRHPIYSSALYGAWGAFLKHPSWLGFILALITTIFLTMTAKVEEDENIRFFGAEYERYIERTKMFVPLIF
jgi:protein-S-isoprenylcysteine O-methyltransferase Ste14